MRESASRGFYLSSQAPYGYRKIKVNDGGKERPKLELVPDQAKIVSAIFSYLFDGKGVKEPGHALHTTLTVVVSRVL